MEVQQLYPILGWYSNRKHLFPGPFINPGSQTWQLPPGIEAGDAVDPILLRLSQSDLATRCRTQNMLRTSQNHGDEMWWKYGYGSIPINTIFSGMNIHLPAILMFTRGTRFWHTAIWINHLILLDVPSKAGWVAHDLTSTQLQGAGGSKPYQIQTWTPMNHHKSKPFCRNHGIFFGGILQKPRTLLLVGFISINLSTMTPTLKFTMNLSDLSDLGIYISSDVAF